jgi:hypothetical protein
MYYTLQVLGRGNNSQIQAIKCVPAVKSLLLGGGGGANFATVRTCPS